MIDFIAHLTRQAAASRGFFGPGPRTKGIIQHIKKELVEVEKVYEGYEERGVPNNLFDTHMKAAREWTDVAILGIDGQLRAIAAAHPDETFDQIALRAVDMIVGKQGKNELRDWPDWRSSPSDAAIEHVRGKHD